MSRNDAEFDEFVAARFPRLRRVSYVIVHDWQQAEDIVQSVLMKVYIAWPRLERQGSLEAYTRRSVVNASISWVRRPKREVVTASLPEPSQVDEDANEGLADWAEVLRQVSPAQAAVIALRFVDDLSVAEVADLLGISEGTVKSQSSRGLAKLRTLTHATTLRRIND